MTRCIYPHLMVRMHLCFLLKCWRTKYRDKVVLVTLSGTWCPNCADEVEFLSTYYRENQGRGLEIVTLLYERYDAFEPAARQGRALQAKHGIDVDILIAGISDKTMASETLPMLSRVLAFPTMIFIDRKGNVRKIHTGFFGPGTGQHYTHLQLPTPTDQMRQ